ncbi:MAG: GtrA family protein [Prevotella sp.]|nr:GtrA family protein [Prevotella sp.]
MRKIRINKRQETRDIIVYLVLGVCTTLVNVAVYWLCYEKCRVANVPSTAVAWVVSVAFAFLTNKPWVFHSRSWKAGTVLREGVKFFWWRFATGVVDVAGMYLFVDVLHANGTLMKFVLNIIVVILNYLFGRFLVFGRRV